MSTKEPTVFEHPGFKYLHLMLSLVLAFIWTLFSFFGWLTALDAATLVSFAFGLVGILVYLVFAFIWSILKHYFEKAFNVIKPQNYTDLGFKQLLMTISLILGVIWAFFNFFTWVGTGVTPATLYTFSLGLVGITMVFVIVLVFEILWVFFHKVSDI